MFEIPSGVPEDILYTPQASRCDGLLEVSSGTWSFGPSKLGLNFMVGAIKKLLDKGYGFIQPQEGGSDLFFHAKSVKGDKKFEDLRVDDLVDYDSEETDKGMAAVNVRKID